jgi:MEMO1 family protein
MKVRHAAWAGQFYPARPELLVQMIKDYLDSVPVVQHGRIVGLIAPHAGYAYSGKTAAVAYRQIQHESYTTVVLLSPSHAAFIDGVSVFDGDSYETPLGKIAIDVDTAIKLEDLSPNIVRGKAGHVGEGEREEHALEVQLPFLQVVLKNFSIVPLVFHDYSWENCQHLGDALAETCDPETTLIVASSDLYHGSSYNQCLRQDASTLMSIENDAAETFCAMALTDDVMACGAGPIAVLKYVTEKWGAQRPRVIARTNSADVVGNEHGYVVGYAAAIVDK